MQKKISTLPFNGTPEQEAQLKEVIAKHIDDPGAVMPVLQEAQDIYGYLPIEVQTMIADGATDFTECGPGKVLQGLVAKIAKGNDNVTAHGIE